MAFGLVVLLSGSLNTATDFRYVKFGPDVTVTLPPNSEVCPPSVAVLVSTEPMLTPLGIAIRNAKRLVVSVPCRRPLIAAGPYVPVGASEFAAAPSARGLT